MTEQMQDHFKKLDEVYVVMEDADASLVNATATVSTLAKALRQGRRKLRQTAEQAQADYGQMAQARDAAIELLTELRDDRIGGVYSVTKPERDRITTVIALLDGSTTGESEDDV